MSRLKGKHGEVVKYTMVPVALIKSLKLNAYDKIIFIIIASYKPSFPSKYRDIFKQSGIKKRNRIAQSLKKLEQNGIIRRYKLGRKIYYETYWDEKPTHPKGSQLVTYGYQSESMIGNRRSGIGNPGLLGSVTDGYSNYTKLIRLTNKISNFSNFETAEEEKPGDEENPKEREVISELISSTLKEIQNQGSSGDE